MLDWASVISFRLCPLPRILCDKHTLCMCLTLLSAQLSYFITTTMNYTGQALNIDPFEHTLCAIRIFQPFMTYTEFVKRVAQRVQLKEQNCSLFRSIRVLCLFLLIFMLPNLSFPINILYIDCFFVLYIFPFKHCALFLSMIYAFENLSLT